MCIRRHLQRWSDRGGVLLFASRPLCLPATCGSGCHKRPDVAVAAMVVSRATPDRGPDNGRDSRMAVDGTAAAFVAEESEDKIA